MFPSILFYCGCVVALLSAVSLPLPVRIARLRRRARVGWAIFGGALAIIGAMWPVSLKRASGGGSQLDAFMPEWQFDECHEIHVDASPERTFAAIAGVTADEILLFRTLTAIRRFGRPGPESILNAPNTKPILDVALQSGFIRLADDPPRETVIGTVVVAPPSARRSGRKLTPDVFQGSLPPGFGLATMNFGVSPDGHGGSWITTETRVFANDESSRKRFTLYWRVIRPGSDIIRRMWLRAIKRRAEGSGKRVAGSG